MRCPHAAGDERTSVRFAATADIRLFLSARTAVALDDDIERVWAEEERRRLETARLLLIPLVTLDLELDRCTPLRWENLATSPASLS